MSPDINDLPTTSLHGSDFTAMRKFLCLHRPEHDTRHSIGTPVRLIFAKKKRKDALTRPILGD